jgi:hypothetical protein
MKPTRPTNEVFTEQEIDSFYAIGKQMLEEAKKERDEKKGIARLAGKIGKRKSLTKEEMMELARDTYTAPMLKTAFLVTRLKALRNEKDKESRHEKADRLLLDYIGSDAVREAFDELDKWYA